MADLDRVIYFEKNSRGVQVDTEEAKGHFVFLLAVDVRNFIYFSAIFIVEIKLKTSQIEIETFPNSISEIGG